MAALTCVLSGAGASEACVPEDDPAVIKKSPSASSPHLHHAFRRELRYTSGVTQERQSMNMAEEKLDKDRADWHQQAGASLVLGCTERRITVMYEIFTLFTNYQQNHIA